MQQGSKAELRIQDALLMNRTSDCWLIRVFLFLKDCRVRSWYLVQNPADGFVPEWAIPADLAVSWCIRFYPKKLRRCFHFQLVFFVTLRLEDIEQHVRNREEKERRILFDRQSATAAKSLRRGMFFFPVAGVLFGATVFERVVAAKWPECMDNRTSVMS